MNLSASGKKGEEEAGLFLEKAGMEIIRRNFRCEAGEIDLVALDGDTLVFLEVKTWTRYGREDLQYAIGLRKQRKIIESAKYFLSKYRKYMGMRIRFDVVFIERGNPPLHLVSAFSESV